MIFDGNFQDDGPWGDGEPRVSKLVFIGKNLDHDELKASFAACLNSAENQEKIQALEEAEAVKRLAGSLLSSAQRDDIDSMQQLLAAGVDPSYSNVVGQTALHIACLWGNLRSIETLVGAGANLNAKNDLEGETPLHMLTSTTGSKSIVGRVEAA